MATLQAMQKARELMKEQGIDLKSAVSQVKQQITPTTPAPTAPITTPTPAPVTPPAPVTTEGTRTPNGATLDANGVVTPASPTPPVTPTNPVTNGVNPTPVTEVKPVKPVTPTKTEPVIDYNKSQGREQEIQANIKQITTDNPALLKDRNAYNQAFGYDTADQGKRAMLDASFTGANTPVLMNQKDIVSALVSGVSVPEQNTQAYRNATVVANQFKKFNSMTDVQLLDNLKQGQIGTELDGLLSQNPNYIKAKQDLAKFQKTASINRAISTISNVIKGNEVTQEDDLAKIESKYNPPLGANAQAYQDYVVKNADVVSAGAQVKQLSTQISDLTKTYNDALKSIKSQYGDMPASALLTLMGSRTSETKELLDSYINAKELAKGDFDLAMKMAEGSYEAYSKDLANQAVIDKEARDMQAQKDLLQYKSDFEKKQAQEALQDPATAIKSIMDEMAKIGVSSTESLQTKVQKAKDYIANGGTLGGYIDEMKKLYAEKPEYKAYLAKQGGTEWQSTSITRYNPSTGANESTPIFYRKKTDGSFEAVDLAGNKIDSSVLTGGGISSGTPGSISATGDMSGLASNYPYEASFKNNNTSGITWGMSANTKKLLENAGIKISEGTARPSREGGKYVKFDNIADGILAHKILLSQAGSDDINARLQQWVGTKEGPIYAKNLMDQAGIKAGTKFSQLTQEQLDKLVMVQIKKESPGMYKELTKGTTTGSTQTQTVSASDQKAFESYDGKSIPEQYKTPAEKKAFVEKYNAWRSNRPGTKIETGNDILNIKIDKPTEGQSASQSYTSRMLNAVNNLMPLEKKFLELGTGGQVAQTYLPSILKSSDQKMMDAEKKNFITAVLRKQSGASIAPSEFAGEELKYFPQPGDSKEVVIAKQNARNAEIKAMLATAGVDAEGNSLSKYYNPPIISSETTTTTPVKTDKITTLKKTYFPSK